MSKSCDILAIQEHWLFNFQLSDIEKRFPSHSAFSKAVDENKPLPPTQKPRGYGGVSVFYRTNLDIEVKKLPFGDSRIAAVEVLSSPPLCICNVYMPSRNSKGEKEGDSYRNCLDQLSEVINTYGKIHAVLVVGDLNASLVTRPGNQQDALLKQFVETNGLSSKQTGENTFFHPNKHDKAEIDYILYNEHGKELVTSVKVQTSDALNTSDHVPVVSTLSIRTGKLQPAVETNRCKPKWDKCNKQVYKQSIKTNLQPFSTFHVQSTSETDILQPLSHLNAVLNQATLDSIPRHRSEIKTRKLRQRP